ncbi:MAG TPA: hypothetical protein VMW27_15010 [Thermoanaerobaculia bacterium]|nr:hypothetical protein [Thermoanaerobaculia bacterium]
MKGPVTARPVAVFGKRSPDRDYEWVGGRNTIPERISAACEQVVRASNETGALLSLVAETAEEEIFLARTFRQGIDGAYRPVLALEVLCVDGGPAPPDWPALARGALEERALASAGSGEPATMDLPASRSSAGARLDGELLDRIRLGLPVSVDSPETARAILTDHPDRYLGVVYAVRMRGGTPPPWRPELAPFVAIQWGQPVLGPEEEEDLRLLERRRPTAEEWSRLSGVAPEKVRRALRWALAPGEDGPPLESVEDALVPWLVTFRRATASGGELFALLQRDLGGRPLGRSIVDDAFPDLSPTARAALTDGAEDGSGEIVLAVLEELAARGLLGWGSPIPPRQWVCRIRESRELTDAALLLLRHRGVGEGWARVLLQLPLPAGAPLDPGEAEAAVETARELGLPSPLDGLRDLIATVRSRSDLEAAVALGRALGDKARELAELADTGRLPAEEPDPVDLALALGARARVFPALDTLKHAAELSRRGWTGSVLAVLDAEERRELPSLSPFAREVLCARVGVGPPPVVRSISEVQALAPLGLARPGDVIPGDRSEELVALADLWPETQALAAVLRGVGGVPLRGSCPDVWLPFLRRALSPERAEAWLSRLGPGEIPAARAWLCQVHELPPGVVGLFAPDRPRRIDGAVLRPALPWVAILAGRADIDERIEILSRLARSRALEGEDRQAAELVEELLPDADWEIHELAVHLLSKVGPLTPLSAIRPAVLAALVPSMDPIGLVNALLTGPSSKPTASPQLVDAVFQRVQKAGVSCPSHGYTAAQLARHRELADRLSELEGWKALAPATPGRSRPDGKAGAVADAGSEEREEGHE